jgi:hypothetical protein
MSTILDALKKVEGERPQSPREQLLHVRNPAATRRRPLSIGIILVCAALGFAAGIGLALWRNASSPSIDEVVEPPPAQDIVAASQLAAPQVAAGVPAVREAPMPEPAAPALATGGAAPAPDSASKPPIAQAAAPGAAPAVVAPAPPAVAAEPGTPSVSATVQGPLAVVVAPGADVKDSALEPSPFAPPRPAPPPVGADARLARAPSPPPAIPAPQPPPQAIPVPDTMAALAPTAPETESPAVVAEPQPSPPTVIDTGRSPPGAPRVLLSFLQWSPDPSRRFAFISVDGAPSQRVREGDMAGSLTVAHITPSAVQFSHEGNLFTIRPRH